MKTSGRTNDNPLALRRNRLQNDEQNFMTSSTNNIESHSHSQNIVNNRPYSKRLDSLGRIDNGSNSNTRLPDNDDGRTGKIDKPIVIHVIDESK